MYLAYKLHSFREENQARNSRQEVGSRDHEELLLLTSLCPMAYLAAFLYNLGSPVQEWNCPQ